MSKRVLVRMTAVGLAAVFAVTCMPTRSYAEGEDIEFKEPQFKEVEELKPIEKEPIFVEPIPVKPEPGIPEPDKPAPLPKEIRDVQDVKDEIYRIDEVPAINPETGEGVFRYPGVDQALDIAQDAVGGDDKNIDTAKQKIKDTYEDLSTVEEKLKDVDYYDWYADELFGFAEQDVHDANMVTILVYERDENGKLLVDEDNNWIPVYELDEDGNIVLDENGNPIQKKEKHIIVGYEEAPDHRIRLVTYEAKGETVSADADVAIEKAGIANTTALLEDAQAVAEAAGAALYDATTGFEAANSKLEEETKKVEAARKRYDEAKGEYDKAVKALEDAEAALDKALSKSYDEEGKPLRDKDGNILYSGDVEEAEKAMKLAKADADKKAEEAQGALDEFKETTIGQIVAQYDLLDEYRNKKLDAGEEWNDDYYKQQARVLCNLMIKNYIRSESEDLVVGDDFEVELAANWEPDGKPYTKLDENGEVIKDKDGNEILWQDYKIATENGYVTFTENKNTSYVYDGKGNLIDTGLFSEAWIKSGSNVFEDENTRVTVTYIKDGKKVTEFYDIACDADGKIYVFRRDWSVVDGEVVIEAKDYKAAQNEVTKETWSTIDGLKEIEIDQETGFPILPETSYYLYKPGTGYIVIDKKTSKLLEWINNPNNKIRVEGNTTYLIIQMDGTRKYHVESDASGRVFLVETWDMQEVKYVTENKTDYTDWTYLVNLYWDQAKAEEAAKQRIKELLDENPFIIKESIGYKMTTRTIYGFWGQYDHDEYRFEITYKTQTKEVLQTFKDRELTRFHYIPDIYKVHNEGETVSTPAVPGNNAYYAEKVWIESADDAFNRADNEKYQVTTNLSEYVEQLSQLKANKKDYERQAARVDAALKKVADLKAQIEKLKLLELDSTTAMTRVSYELAVAERAVETAKATRDELQKKINAATQAVKNIDLSRFNPSPVPGPTPGPTPGPSEPSSDVANPTTVVAAAAEPAADVLGEVRNTTTNRARTTTRNSTDNAEAPDLGEDGANRPRPQENTAPATTADITDPVTPLAPTVPVDPVPEPIPDNGRSYLIFIIIAAAVVAIAIEELVRRKIMPKA